MLAVIPGRASGMADRARRLRVLGTVAGSILVASCGGAPTAAPMPTTSESAATQLRELITDVRSATAHRYRLTDDLGNWMDTAKIISIPGTPGFVAVYHAWNEADEAFHVELASSPDLINWTWQVELADRASQPTIAVGSDGGFVVAWEQEPDPIHLVIASYATLGDLHAGVVGSRFDVPVTMPACGEGTPSIEAASSQGVSIGFHYHADCERDRQAGGATDWTTWHASARPALDRALVEAGVGGHIGDRDTISFHGHELMLIEGQLTYEDSGSWRTFLYDTETDSAEQLRFRTHAGSSAVSNPTVTQVTIDGRAAIVVTLYLPTEGARGEEDGPLLFYRTLDGGPPS